MAEIYWEFISEQEGGCTTTGYVPRSGTSGVTIATGFDIGQRTRKQIMDMDIDYDLRLNLARYAGATDHDAESLLEQFPLELTKNEAYSIDFCIEEEFEDMISYRWNRDANRSWDNLTIEQRTVVMSISFQYGTPWRRCPSFWGYATSGDWVGVVNELKNFGDDYPSRRHREADFLEGI